MGAVRLLAGIGLLVTIVIQINDRVVNNAFDPWEYFSYFTIETSLMNIVVFIVGGILAFRLSRDTELFTTVRMATLTYAIITAGVYNLLLRNVPYNGFQGLSWPNEVIHVWIPILIVLDWLISPGRPALSWKALRVVMIYPLLWLAYSLVRGAVSNGIYPYPFLDPATAGWGSVIAYIVALSLVLLGLAALAIVYSRRVGREAIRRQS
ncbi:hypothetical protein ASF79_12210 [Agreia sp. Leaf335]|nr:hypothetical protein ASE64_08495 [Agreia sp. Leaf210]KQR20306.1 hypothetical protein ASF79_12210 [Agreia sp. Leaf335]